MLLIDHLSESFLVQL